MSRITPDDPRYATMMASYKRMAKARMETADTSPQKKQEITPAEAGYLSLVTGKSQEEIADKVEIVETIEPTGSYIEEVTGEAPPKEWLKEQTDTFKKLQKKREQEITKEKTRTAAEKRAKKKLPALTLIDPSKFVDIPTPGAVGAPMPGTVGAIVHGTVIEVGLKAKEGIGSVLNSWAAHNDKLYKKGNFLTDKEKAAWLKEVQNDPFLAYDIMTGTTGEKPPKTVDEVVNRMNYLVSEMALGGAREVALPFSIDVGKPRRMEDAILQVVGGLLTPSPADYLVSTTFRTLAGAGKEGLGLMRKAMRGVALSSDEAIQFEKLIGQYGYSTNDLRKAGTKLNRLSNAEWDELVKGYENYYDFWKKNPELYGAGAAYKPSALLQFEDILDDLGYEAGEYIDFLKTNKLGPTFNPATLAAFASGLKPPTPDLKAFDKIESDLETFRESQEKMLEEVQEKPVITGPVTREKIKPKEPTEPGYTPPEEVIEEEDDLVKPGYTPPKEEVDVIPDVIPDIVPDVIPDVVPDEVPDIVPDEPEPPKPDLPVPRKRKDGGLPPNIFKALVGGKNEGYRIKFDYPKGTSESFTVKARSFPQALSQAQGLRRVRHVPSEVDIAKTGVTK